MAPTERRRPNSFSLSCSLGTDTHKCRRRKRESQDGDMGTYMGTQRVTQIHRQTEIELKTSWLLEYLQKDKLATYVQSDHSGREG